MKCSPALAAFLVLCIPTASSSAELRSDTLAAWDRYIATLDARVKTVSAKSAFLWVDEDRGRGQRVQRGEAVALQVQAESAVPHGLIHDWIGAVFVPDATLTDVFAVAHAYDDYPKWYGPTVSQANLLGRDGDVDIFMIRYVRTVLWVTSVLEVEYETHYFQVDATRWYSITRSSGVQEIEQYGRRDERKMPPDDGNGYLWRIYSVSRYEQRDNGVYIEQENVGLSRQIPAAFRWMVEPVVNRLSKDLLVRSLQQSREAVLSKSGGSPGLCFTTSSGAGCVSQEPTGATNK